MIHIQGSEFKDEQGRTLMLRGVNLGGSSKVPFPNGATYIREGFFEQRVVSFVGRPFPLAEADEHFRRLREWGLTFLRFLVTWEAIEHAGPGRYDEEYLDYVRAVVKKAADYGLQLFIDPHQDVWSRFSGGDGAPGWTLEAIGFDLTQLHASGAAIVHALHGDPFPKMVWQTNGNKLAAATMFTLFFGGNDFAPQTRVAGEPAQEYLQRHYIAAIQQLAARLSDLPNVIGYDTLNEPLSGYIGWRDLKATAPLSFGVTPSPYQSMLLGAGLPQEAAYWKVGRASIRRVGTRLVNPQGVRAWREGFDCIWRQHGVWDMVNGRPALLRPDYFAQMGGRAADLADYYRPFANRFAAAIRLVDPRALIFVEADPMHLPPSWDVGDAQRIVFAPHWYDGMVLVTKHYSSFLAVNAQTGKLLVGARRIRQTFARTLALVKQNAQERLGGAPTLLGEFGIPFDLDDKRAYRRGDARRSDYAAQTRALDRSFQAVEANLLNGTLWNYTADNDHLHGDQWNDEDLSIYRPRRSSRRSSR